MKCKLFQIPQSGTVWGRFAFGIWEKERPSRLFGYVKPFKPELKIREYDTYKAVYCGLCEQLGASFGPLARLTLSYDFTFLSMLYTAVSGEAPVFREARCCVNPLKKVKMCVGTGPSDAQVFSAHMAALMIYYKVLDNIEDSGFWKGLLWRMVKPVAGRARKKAAAAWPEADRLIAQSMEQQGVAEREGLSTDACCEPTAAAMAGICGMLSEEPGPKRILERMGYLLGRYVYLCDALDDAEEDFKTGGFNPLLNQYIYPGGPVREGAERAEGEASGEQWERLYTEAKQSLYLTAGELEKACDLLELKHYRPIIQNVTCMGLRAGVEEILSKKGDAK